MSINKIGRFLKKEVTGVTEELTKIDVNDFSGRRPSRIICKNSIGYSFSILLISLILFVVLLFSIDSDSYFFYLLFVLPITFLVVAIVQLNDRKPKLIVSEKGIWTPTLNIPWEKVVSTKFRIENGRSAFLVIMTENKESVIDIGHLDTSLRFLGHQIELLKQG